MTHPKLFPTVLSSLQLNQMMIGEAFEEIWLEKEGASETTHKDRARVGDLRLNAERRSLNCSSQMRTCIDTTRRTSGRISKAGMLKALLANKKLLNHHQKFLRQLPVEILSVTWRL